jgi:hypothetical protein
MSLHQLRLARLRSHRVVCLPHLDLPPLFWPGQVWHGAVRLAPRCAARWHRFRPPMLRLSVRLRLKQCRPAKPETAAAAVRLRLRRRLGLGA